MKIEDCGEIRSFEPMPTEGSLYLTAVCYSNNYWASGPSGMDKAEVIKSLASWVGCSKARIYVVKVPLSTLPAA